jgi:hypothetical protein
MTVIEEMGVSTKEKWGRGKMSRGERELFDMGSFSWGLSREAAPASCRRPWDDVGDKGEGEGEGNRGGRGGRGTEEDKRRECIHIIIYTLYINYTYLHIIQHIPEYTVFTA